MYILDTDYLSILDRGGATAELLLQRLASVDRAEVAVSIIGQCLTTDRTPSFSPISHDRVQYTDRPRVNHDTARLFNGEECVSL